LSDGSHSRAQQLWVMTETNGAWSLPDEETFAGDGWNNIASWGELRLMSPKAAP